MISLHTPLWLLLLGVIPLIYWLHRFSQQPRTFPTTTLFLWRTFQQHADIDGAPTRPDPRWLLRALIAALLILSLTAPAVETGQGPPIDVWVDDSLSMFTREQQHQRIELAMDQLQNYLVGIRPAHIQLHSLGNPSVRLVLDPDDASGWQARLAEWTSLPRGEPSPPPAATLSPESNHVLVSDGADRALNNWALTAPLQRIIRVGDARMNIALTRLSLRESLNQTDRINGIARIDNTGDIPQQTRLILQQQAQIIETRQIEIPASAYSITAFTIPAGAGGKFQARIESANDPLPLDDSLTLELDQLHHHLRYAMPARCGRYITAVLDSEPALAHDESRPDVIIDCSAQAREFAQPAVIFHAAQSVRHTTQTAHWHTAGDMESLRLEAGIPYGKEAPVLTSAAVPILSADGRLLILRQRDSAQVIDAYVDASDPVFAGRAEYPLLILGLIAQVTGRNLDAAPLTTASDIDASRIAPLALTAAPATPDRVRPVQTSLVPLLLFAILLLLGLDAAIAGGLFRGFGKQRR